MHCFFCIWTLCFVHVLCVRVYVGACHRVKFVCEYGQIHTSRMNLSDDVDLEEFILSKDELSGADVKVGEYMCMFCLRMCPVDAKHYMWNA